VQRSTTSQAACQASRWRPTPVAPPLPGLSEERIRSSALRAQAAGVLAVSLGVLAVAVWLKPDPAGFGTHEQLGLAPCSMLVLTGYPCPTCGMTTAFACTVRGQWGAAIAAQPGGFVLALGTMTAGVLAAVVLVRGRGWRGPWHRVSPTFAILAVTVLMLLGWGVKIVIGLCLGTLPVQRL